MNNFQQLLNEEEENYQNQDYHDEIRNNLEGTFGFFRFFGQIVEVYLPQMVDVLVMASGAEEPPPLPPHFEPPSSGGKPEFPGRRGPDSPDEIIPRT
ncbi:MAG: hypothetical protein KTR30_13320 [Saprospiraceae bacterium]|nr:hypothetical protein [Saprospiraceae bacterium]